MPRIPAQMGTGGAGGAGTPLYQCIYETLRDDIAAGRRAAGTRLPTEQQLAAAFQVSVGTVRKASDMLAREGLIHRQRRRGSFVADRLLVQRTVLCLSRRDPFGEQVSPFHGDLARTVLQACREHSFKTAMGSFEAAPGDADGCIFLTGPADARLVSSLVERGVPHAMVGRKAGRYTVGLDALQGARLAIEQLKVQGASRFTSVHYDKAVWQGVRTIGRQLKMAVEEQVNLPRRASMAEIEHEAYEAMRVRLQQGKRPPTALLLLDDIVARGVTRALLQARQHMPGRAESLPPVPPIVVNCSEQQVLPFGLPVTYVVHDTHALARALVDLLARQFDGSPASSGSQIDYRVHHP